MKYSFYNDYSEGAHPHLLEALSRTNLVQEEGYSVDQYCHQAAERIKEKVAQPGATVHFVSGGTQANLLVLASLMKPYEAVIASVSGHIAVHETGAIEATGHKILTVAGRNGKLTPEEIKEVVISHTDEHMVKPRVVFISQSTEIGTIYSKAELEALSAVCKQHSLLLYMDGARLGSALTAQGSDVTLPDIARLVDAFYIGGTKNGALLGEAIVLVQPEIQLNFRYHLKQRGALLAKGRILGVQFLELFTNELFFQLATQANTMAGLLRLGIADLGYTFLTESTTNQIFPILPNTVLEKLQPDYGYYVWEKQGTDKAAIRLVTSWATKEEAVQSFLTDLKQAKG